MVVNVEQWGIITLMVDDFWGVKATSGVSTVDFDSQRPMRAGSARLPWKLLRGITTKRIMRIEHLNISQH